MLEQRPSCHTCTGTHILVHVHYCMVRRSWYHVCSHDTKKYILAYCACLGSRGPPAIPAQHILWHTCAILYVLCHKADALCMLEQRASCHTCTGTHTYMYI